ncbi:MAG: hypothetical protein WB780_09075 [Candidatus Acidiferrales bacterium]
MGIARVVRLVTLEGECFDADYEGLNRYATRDGVFYMFRLTSLKPGNGTRLVSVWRFGPMELLSEDYTDERLKIVRLNTIRRAFDSGTLNFEPPFDELGYRELQMSATDFTPRSSTSDEEIKQFIMNKAYWMSWKVGNRQLVQFDDPVDLDYLGVDAATIKKYQWLLEQRQLLEKSQMPGVGRPTAQLVDLYEATESSQHLNERVFPQGTQYEAFKVVSAIFRTASNGILIADNYLNDEVLDMLAAMPKQPVLKLLTYKPRADFKVAVRRFMSQYGAHVEVRVHDAEIHDRAIVIDSSTFYTFGHSIKDLGKSLSVMNKLENASPLRVAIQSIWATASTLCPKCGNEFHATEAKIECQNCENEKKSGGR